MFSVGDTVVYRHHVCRVASIREKYFDDKDYYELHTLFENSLKLYAPVEDSKPPLLRRPLTKHEALDLIDSVVDVPLIDELFGGKLAATSSLAERQVKDEYERRLKSGNSSDLIPIIRSAYERGEHGEGVAHRVSAVDKKYRELAERLLYDELSVSLSMEREDVPAFVMARVKKMEKK